MFVYVITNLVNGKRYVGQTIKSLRNRLAIHDAFVKRGSDFYLHRAMRKYGMKNFFIAALVEVSSKWEMDLYEKGLIKAWNLRDSKEGYNQTDGGEGTPGRTVPQSQIDRIRLLNLGKPMSERTRKKLKKSLKGKIPWSKGKTFSEEYRKKLSAAKKGKSLSEEHKKNISNALKKSLKQHPERLEKLLTTLRRNGHVTNHSGKQEGI